MVSSDRLAADWESSPCNCRCSPVEPRRARVGPVTRWMTVCGRVTKTTADSATRRYPASGVWLSAPRIIRPRFASTCLSPSTAPSMSADLPHRQPWRSGSARRTGSGTHSRSNNRPSARVNREAMALRPSACAVVMLPKNSTAPTQKRQVSAGLTKLSSDWPATSRSRPRSSAPTRAPSAKRGISAALHTA